MALPAGLLVPAGLLLILISLADVTLTVLHVQAEGPISNQVQRTIWRAVVLLSRPVRGIARDRLLASGMPLMMVATIGFWVALYLVGFALIYTPFIYNAAWFAHQTPDTSAAPLAAIYFSTVSFVTLGYGDVVPVNSLMRVLAVSEGLLGLLTVSFAVTYLLSVYPLVTRKVALAASLNQELAGRSDGVAVAERYVAADHFGAYGERLRALHEELLALGHAHSLHPLLFYMRPIDLQESFVRVLALIQGLVWTLRYLLDPERHAEVVTDPRLAVLEEGLLYTLHTLGRSAHLDRVDPVAPRAESSEWGPSADETLAALAEAGITTVDVGDAACRERLERFLRATSPLIYAYAVNLRYEPQKVWATYDRGARDTALDTAAPDRPQPIPR